MRVLFLLMFMVCSVSSYSVVTQEQNEYIIPYGFEADYRTPQIVVGGHIIGGAIPSEKSAFLSAKEYGHKPWTAIHPLLRAILTNPSEIESIVKESKVDLDHRINGRLPLLFAVFTAESPSAVEALLKAGANVNSTVGNFYGITDSLLSVQSLTVLQRLVVPEVVHPDTVRFRNTKNIIKLLVQYGADLSVTNQYNQTPYMQALYIYSRNNGGLYNLPKELMSFLRKSKTPSEIVSEFETLIKQFESMRQLDVESMKNDKTLGVVGREYTYKQIADYQKQISRLKQFMEQEFATLIEGAKDEQERQNLRAILNSSSHRSNLVLRTMHDIGCRLSFLTRH